MLSFKRKTKTIQENLEYFKKWFFEEVVGKIPAEIEQKADFHFIIFELLKNERGFQMRAIVSVSFFGYRKEDASFYRETLAALTSGDDEIRWDWMRDKTNAHLFDNILCKFFLIVLLAEFYPKVADVVRVFPDEQFFAVFFKEQFSHFFLPFFINCFLSQECKLFGLLGYKAGRCDNKFLAIWR